MFRDDPQVHIIGHWTYPAGTQKNSLRGVQLPTRWSCSSTANRSGAAKIPIATCSRSPTSRGRPGEIKAVSYANGKAVATDVRAHRRRARRRAVDADHRARRVAGGRLGRRAVRRRGRGCRGGTLSDVSRTGAIRTGQARPSGAAATTAAKPIPSIATNSISNAASIASPCAPAANRARSRSVRVAKGSNPAAARSPRSRSKW